jgi:hypothetical protein
MRRYAKNAFVRAFYFASHKDCSLAKWKRFVREFRGASKEDVTKIEEILRDREYVIIDEMPTDAAFEREVRNRIYEIRHISPSAFVPKSVGDRIVRDAKMFAFLKMQKPNLRNSFHKIAIISSSPVLQRAARDFSKELGDHGTVWPVGAIAYLLSLIPGARLTLSTLRKCLFDEHDFDSMDQITQFALRVIRRSTEYSIGYAQRPTLKHALQAQIDKAAKQRGQRPSELVAELLDPERIAQNKEKLTEIIATAVDEFEASATEKRKAKKP